MRSYDAFRRGATCDRISSGKGPVDFSQEKHVNDDEDDYVNDTFESECSDEAAEEKNGSHPSETGTYTVDKEEDDSPTSIQVNISLLQIQTFFHVACS